MKICEEFYTLQGEGKFVGVPSYFIRTTGCNLRCAWKNADGSITKCDTPYTSWNPEKGAEFNLEKTLRKIRMLNVNHIVITGGEPTLQADLPDVINRMKLPSSLYVTVETNGTTYLRGMQSAFMSISPKLRSSYWQDAGSIQAKIHKANNEHLVDSVKLWVAANDYQLKFVVTNPDYFDGNKFTTIDRKIINTPKNNNNIHLWNLYQWVKFAKYLEDEGGK